MAAARIAFQIGDTFTADDLINCIQNNHTFDYRRALTLFREILAASGADAGQILQTQIIEATCPYDDGRQWSLITVAARRGNLDAVRFLLTCRVDPNEPISDTDPHTALILAAERCDADGRDVAACLLENENTERDITVNNHNPASKVIDTFISGTGSAEHLRAILTLLHRPEIPLELSEYEPYGGNVLTYNLANAQEDAKIARCIEATAIWRDLDGSMSMGGYPNPLIEAINANSQEKDRRAILLLEQGFDPNTPDRAGFTPLHHAIREHNIEIFDALIAHGARIDARTPRWKFAGDTKTTENLNLADVTLKDEKRAQVTGKGALKAWTWGREHMLKTLAERGVVPTQTIATATQTILQSNRARALGLGVITTTATIILSTLFNQTINTLNPIRTSYLSSTCTDENIYADHENTRWVVQAYLCLATTIFSTWLLFKMSQPSIRQSLYGTSAAIGQGPAAIMALFSTWVLPKAAVEQPFIRRSLYGASAAIGIGLIEASAQRPNLNALYRLYANTICNSKPSRELPFNVDRTSVGITSVAFAELALIALALLLLNNETSALKRQKIAGLSMLTGLSITMAAIYNSNTSSIGKVAVLLAPYLFFYLTSAPQAPTKSTAKQPERKPLGNTPQQATPQETQMQLPGRVVEATQQGGNCFFDSVAHELMRQELVQGNISQRDLREMAVTALEERVKASPESLGGEAIALMNGNRDEPVTLEAYLNAMRQDGRDAEGPIIEMLAITLNVRLIIHDQGRQQSGQGIYTINENAPENRTISLLQTGLHYQVIEMDHRFAAPEASLAAGAVDAAASRSAQPRLIFYGTSDDSSPASAPQHT